MIETNNNNRESVSSEKKTEQIPTMIFENMITHLFNSQSKNSMTRIIVSGHNLSKMVIDGKKRVGYFTDETKEPTLTNLVSHQK